MLRQLLIGSPFRTTFFDRPPFVKHQDSGRIRTESWRPCVQRTRGYVVGQVWLLCRHLASGDLERVSIVDSISCEQPRDFLATRQLRKRAGITELWMRLRKLGLCLGNHPQPTNRGIDVSERQGVPKVSYSEPAEED